MCIQNSLNVYVWIYIYHSLRCMFSFQLLTVVRRCLIRDLKYTNTYFEKTCLRLQVKKTVERILNEMLLFSLLHRPRVKSTAWPFPRLNTDAKSDIYYVTARSNLFLFGGSFTYVFRAMEKSHLYRIFVLWHELFIVECMACIAGFDQFPKDPFRILHSRAIDPWPFSFEFDFDSHVEIE